VSSSLVDYRYTHQIWDLSYLPPSIHLYLLSGLDAGCKFFVTFVSLLVHKNDFACVSDTRQINGCNIIDAGEKIDKTIVEMKTLLDITIEGTLTDFLGVNIDRRDDGTIKLMQTKLIDQVVKDLNLDGDY
jgi:hypothetical protein